MRSTNTFLRYFDSKSALIVLGAVWISVIAGGFLVLAREEFTPVEPTTQSAFFPAHSAIQFSRDKPTLVLFIHPQCPCTQATFDELDRIRAETQDKIAVNLVFTIPDGVPAGWEKGDLWNSAAKMAGVRVVRDRGGEEAHRFNVTGSGHALLYDTSGKLIFSGGITASRGHEGDNAGHAAIVSLVLDGYSLVSRTPVFGCSLL
jgi:hypothetical protein